MPPTYDCERLSPIPELKQTSVVADYMSYRLLHCKIEMKSDRKCGSLERSKDLDRRRVFVLLFTMCSCCHSTYHDSASTFLVTYSCPFCMFGIGVGVNAPLNIINKDPSSPMAAPLPPPQSLRCQALSHRSARCNGSPKRRLVGLPASGAS